MNIRSIGSKVIVVALLASFLAGGLLFAMADAKGPATQPTTRKAGRTPQDIMKELNEASQQISEALPNPMVIFKADTRAEVAPKVIPPLKRLSSLLDEMANHDARAKDQVGQGQLELYSLLTLLGDAETEAKLKKNAESKDPGEAALAQAALLTSRWWKNDTNAAEQAKVVADLQALARTYPQDNLIAQATMMMLQQGGANAELKQQLEGVITNDLKGELAKELGKHLQEVNALRNLENKPLTITGTTLEGKAFTTADWKGKVVLVDFWATWCRPCIAELPRIQKLYKDYHGKGLEIVGISNDFKEADLKSFVEKNKAEMPWPQLVDKEAIAAEQWHRLAREYGVRAIPTMFLIDRKGVVRSVAAREKLEELLPKLLEEKAQ